VVHGSGKYLALGKSIFDLVDLDLTEALDFEKIATGSCRIIEPLSAFVITSNESGLKPEWTEAMV
jgi:hypothetical protein